MAKKFNALRKCNANRNPMQCAGADVFGIICKAHGERNLLFAREQSCLHKRFTQRDPCFLLFTESCTFIT